MKILSICTSGKNCSVALLDNQSLIKESNDTSGLTHSQTLLPSIMNLLDDTKMSLKNIDYYAVSVGPGSFTGIRIGISTVKGFCLGVDKPVVEVPSLLGLAYNVADFKGYIVSCIDAKNDNIYARIYLNEEKITSKSEYIVDSIDALIEQILTLDKPIIIVGDGSEIVKSHLPSDIKVSINYAPEEKSFEYGSSLGLAAFDLINQGVVTDGVKLTPLYLKKSQAERELESKSL